MSSLKDKSLNVDKEIRKMKELLVPKVRKEAIRKITKDMAICKSLKDMEELYPTLELLMDKKAIRGILSGLEDVKAGRFTSIETL